MSKSSSSIKDTKSSKVLELDNDKNLENFKQIQLEESIILIDNIQSNSKSVDNNSSSDSVQEVDDWAHVKPKARRVRREQ